jgi:hypothetical protein
MVLIGCDSGGDGDDGTATSVQDFGGSIPKGDYVTADINDAGTEVTIKNHTTGTEKTLNFGSLADQGFSGIGSSIVKATQADNDGNHYFMILTEGQVLALQKVDSDGNPVSGEIPFFMFEKETITAGNLKGKAFNFLEFFADANGKAAVELGIVGFDTDTEGSLYGAAYDSEDQSMYSITNGDDGIPDTGDEFTLDQTSEQPDGALVLWENGVDNWQAATTLTGSTAGPVVLDHGPDAGGGAGFAIPQVTTTDADTFWNKAAGDYFLVRFLDEGGVDYLKLETSQDSPGKWPGNIKIYNLGNPIPILETKIVELSSGTVSDIESNATFSNAESTSVQNATQGKGVFEQNSTNPMLHFAFDPKGNYVGVVNVNASEPGFGLAIKDPNWQ